MRVIKRGTADVSSWSFSTSLHDASYSKCHVSYTDPTTGKTIEYTYTPRNEDKDGQVLEVTEKVSNREEARQLAMKRLRQKKGEPPPRSAHRNRRNPPNMRRLAPLYAAMSGP